MQNQLAMSELSLLHSQFPHLATWIKLKLDNGEEVEGQIFTYDKISNVVVLQQKCESENGIETLNGSSNKYNFRIIKISYIKEISIPSNKEGKENQNNINGTSSPSSSTNPNTPTSSSENADSKNSNKNDNKNKKNNQDTNSTLSTLVPVNQISIDSVIQRERRALEEEFQRQNRIGVGVSEEAQQIFDALSKTMPCSWNNKSIVVMDEVIISSPYNAENSKLAPGKQGAESILERVRKVLEFERRKIRENKKK